MRGMRGERMNEELRRELSDILHSRVGDPGIGHPSVTRVEVSADYTHARVYVSFFGGEEAEARGQRALERASAFIRGELGRRLRLRRVPELAFRVDHGIEHSFRIQEELRELGLDGGGGEGSAPDARREDGEDAR